jgi:hypothetical protein
LTQINEIGYKRAGKTLFWQNTGVKMGDPVPGRRKYPRSSQWRR